MKCNQAITKNFTLFHISTITKEITLCILKRRIRQRQLMSVIFRRTNVPSNHYRQPRVFL